MSNLAVSLGTVILFEMIAFSVLYRFTRWQGKQVAFLVVLVVIGLYLPYSVLTWEGLDIFAIHFAFYVMIPYVLGIITTHWEVRESMEGPSRGKWFHWGPAAMVVFFIAIAVVDAAIITFAQNGMSQSLASKILPQTRSGAAVNSFFPGTVSHDFHQKESMFNEYLEQRLEQERRGWLIRKGWVGAAVAGQPAVFRIAVKDKDGQAITAAEVNGQFFRPSDSRMDQQIELVETGGGEYEAHVILPAQGVWDVVISITRDGDTHEVRAATKVEPGKVL